MSARLPLYQQILLDLMAPPVITALWWLRSRSLVNDLQRKGQSGSSESKTDTGIWIVWISLTLLMFAATIYFNVVA
jgi:hypothetical protein